MYGDKQYDSRLNRGVPKELTKLLGPGDIVTLDADMAVAGVIERRNVLSRKRRDSTRRSYTGAEEQVIAANVDVAAIVASAKNPPLHPKFIDRYMVLIQHNDIDPVICLSKTDLASEEELRTLEEYRNLGFTAIEVSNVTGQGIDQLSNLLRGKTAVLVGQSGVGKTSLINSIHPTQTFTTGEVSNKSGKGRHTTTSSSLYKWDEDSYIIDTPGIRSLEIWDIDPPELRYYYPEFDPYAPNCRYSNCSHWNEPIGACAVKQAMADSAISEGRYESYIKILSEL